MITATIDSKRCREYLDNIAGKQLQYAAANTLNTLALAGQTAETVALDKHLDRPTPFTRMAYEVVRANKGRLIASVRARPIQAEYLKWQVRGGVEGPKKRAIVLPRAIGTNTWGNMTKGAIKTALSKPNVFSGKPGGGMSGPAGIWQRLKGRGKGDPGQLRLLVAYTPRATYTPLLPFGQATHREVDRLVQPVFKRQFEDALRSAR